MKSNWEGEVGKVLTKSEGKGDIGQGLKSEGEGQIGHKLSRSLRW